MTQFCDYCLFPVQSIKLIILSRHFPKFIFQVKYLCSFAHRPSHAQKQTHILKHIPPTKLPDAGKPTNMCAYALCVAHICLTFANSLCNTHKHTRTHTIERVRRAQFSRQQSRTLVSHNAYLSHMYAIAAGGRRAFAAAAEFNFRQRQHRSAPILPKIKYEEDANHARNWLWTVHSRRLFDARRISRMRIRGAAVYEIGQCHSRKWLYTHIPCRER